ncbi:MAG TPA: 23S rRNA (uracil-5-)-methyltransferase RumA, partial [Clostridiales bacterium]|nr:23S rRNA (uracil-5-)-methyltransferase RumA [Clostridiales bacterium]
MNIKLNEEYEVTIIDMGTEGEGIGKIEGVTIFISGGIKGDTVKVKITKVSKNYVLGRIIKLIKESELRQVA